VTTTPAGRIRAARLAYAGVAAVTAFALLAQLFRTVNGVGVVPGEDPGLATRLVRLASYFTIQSNLLVLITSLALLVDYHRDTFAWRVLRLNAVAGISLTALVHWALLRPLASPTGWAYALDKLLHAVVPALAVFCWCLLGPRAQVTWRAIWASLLWPVAWLGYILGLGAATGWYPYPFLNVAERGAGPVAVTALALAGLLVGLSAVLLALDRRLPIGWLERVSTAPEVPVR